MDPHRAERISEALREELAEIIQYELHDPRLAGVTVTAVHVGSDLRHAHVVILMPDRDKKIRAAALEGLDRARTYLRREVTARLRLFRVPELHFLEESADSPATRVEELINRVRKNRAKELKNQQE
jgi:ribosome-binding factor A